MKHIAIVGAGYWGRNLVRNFHQLGVLKTVCDRDENIRREMERNYPEAGITGEYGAVLDDGEIWGVVIAAPAVTHFALAREAILAGKNVFVEKPLSLTHEDGCALVDLAREKGKILFVGHILQYHPAIVKLKEMINGGSVGRLEYIYSHRLSLGKIRREENILWSFAPHDISIILSIVGEEPIYVDSVGSNVLHARIADVTLTNLKFASGIGAHIFVSWLNPFKEQRLVVVGSQGMLVFDDTKDVEEKLVLYPHTINWRNGVPVPEKAEVIAIDLRGIWEEPMKAECTAFLRALETGAAPITSGDEGLRVLRVLEASQRSLEEKENAPARTAVPPPASRDYFVHGTAIIDNGVSIGAGSKIWHFSHVLSGSRIGENCNIGQNVVIGPDVTIGNGCKVQNNVSIFKGVTIEDDVFCGPSMVFTNVFNPRAHIRRMDELRPTLVRKGATIGANATIVCGTTLGRYAFVGAGALVNRDVPDHALVVGNPSREIGWVCACGERLPDGLRCPTCDKEYRRHKGTLVEKRP